MIFFACAITAGRVAWRAVSAARRSAGMPGGVATGRAMADWLKKKSATRMSFLLFSNEWKCAASPL